MANNNDEPIPVIFTEFFFIKYCRNFQITDLLGFGNILGIKEENNFENYVTNIVVAFSEQNRKKKRALLKLAKDISEANIDFDKNKDKE